MMKTTDTMPRKDGAGSNRREITRRGLLGGALSLAAAGPILGSSAGSIFGSSTALASGHRADETTASPGCREWTQPTDADFAAIVGKSKVEFLDRAFSVIEKEVAPKTLEGVRSGSKLFGGAVLDKADLSTVVVATNTEAENPLLHGEITLVNTYYAIPKAERPPVKRCIFISTHEPCPLCIAGITWGGFDNFFFLWTYEDSRDEYGIPHDLEMLDQIFRCPEGSYNEKNKYFSAWSLRDLIPGASSEEQKRFDAQVARLKRTYADLSEIYQKAKAAGTGADVPLK